MKNIFIAGFIFVVLFLSSCEKDYLEMTPDENLTLEQVFSDRRNTEAFLVNVYNSQPEEMNFTNDWGLNPFVGGSDELDLPFTNAFGNAINTGAWSPTNNGSNPTPWIWDNAYDGIRKANIFLENIDNASLSPELITRWKGEATFLRAFFHFNLLRTYGPIILLNQSIPTSADFRSYRRNTLEECVDFIVNECNNAASLMEMNVVDGRYGTATKAAALALKARTLLYMASPLYNGNPAYANFTDNEGVRLFPQEYRAERWQAAAQAAKECIDQLEASGYRLYKSGDNDPVKNYQELFLARNNPEIIYTRTLGVYSQFEYVTTPNGMGGWSGLSPTQEVVDAYEMNNGEAPITGYNPNGSPIINTASGYQENGYVDKAHPKGYYPARVRNMYVNREPRFYASINFNGQYWRTRQIEFYKEGGRDAQKGGPDYSPTGYLLKKFSDPTVNAVQGIFTLKTWIYFRLGEQYLNYAEALNEAEGPVADVYKYVNAIRERSGLPNLPAGLSKEQMREKIRHERQIELAFETHRYFDTRRWKIAEQTDNREIHGMNISTGNSIQDDRFYERKVVERRVFDVRHYLWPIPQPEIDQNPNLVQNLGW